MSAPRIALATCAAFPDGDADDAGLPDALGGAVFAVWDDPGVAWDAFDLVLVRSTWDYSWRRDAFLAWAAALGSRVLNPPAVLAWNTDKRYLGELGEAGLPVVGTTFVPPGAAMAWADGDGGEVVVKPTVSAGSRDTARFGPTEAAGAAALVAAIHASGRTAMVQPYIGSVDDRGETALLYFDGRFSHAVAKGPLLAPGTPPTTEVFAPEALVAREATPGERAVAERVLAWSAERFGTVPVYARVDLVQDAAGAPLLLELELTEPSLFLAHAPGAQERLAAALQHRIHR